MFTELRQTAVWFLGIYLAVFCIAGLFIYLMMKRTVQQMEKLQEVAGKQEMLMGALAHEMKTPLTSIIGYSDTLKHFAGKFFKSFSLAADMFQSAVFLFIV